MGEADHEFATNAISAREPGAVWRQPNAWTREIMRHVVDEAVNVARAGGMQSLPCRFQQLVNAEAQA